MSTKIKIVIISLIVLTLSILFRTGGLKLQISTNQHRAEQTDFFSGSLINVTGMLLMTPDGRTLEAWQHEIAHTRSLDFRLYSFSYPPIIDLFKQMVHGGVEMRAIIEDKQFGNDTKTFDKLKKSFSGMRYIDIQSDKKLHDNFMHAKTFVTDTSYIIQTANLTYPSFYNNREFFFISLNPIIRTNLKELFAKDRAGEKLENKDIHPNLLFCPVNCRAKIETVISGAQHSIRMYQQYIQDEHIMSMLMERSGLDLKFIVADNSSKEQLMASPLKQFTHFRKKPYVHAKMILVDDTYLIVSSINMSANSMDENREIGIILIDAGIIEKFRGQFEKDWKK